MKTFAIVALSVLTTLVSAVPMVKRDVVWVTETDIDTVVVPVTKTVWVDYPGASEEAVVSTSSHHRHHHTVHVTSTVTLPSSSSSPASPESTATSPSSVYVAPTPSSTSVYVAPTTSSTYVAPTTSSTSVYVAPTTSAYVAPTTSAYVAPTTTSSAPASTSSASSGSGSYTGSLTYYAVGLGSCGLTSTEDQAIVALDVDMMTANWSGNPNDNPLCGKEISITYNGVTKSATIVDTCEGCPSSASLDLSQSLFEEFAPTSKGVLAGATWSYI